MHVIFDHLLSRILALLAGIALSLPWLHASTMAQGGKIALASMLLTYAFIPAVIHLADRMGALDVPDARRLHQQPTPRLGGLAVFLSVNLTLLLNFNYSLALKGVCISAALVALLSFWDDIRELSAGIKLAGQLVALTVLAAFGVHVEFAPDIWWGYLAEYVVTALWMVGITNAFNFLDGVNGLAACLAASVCLLMGLLAWNTGQTFMLLLCLAVAGAALGFLPDNARYRQPARIFLGDVGSTYLGWMMAGIAVMGGWSSEGALKAYTAPVLIFSVMIFDMVYTTIARAYRGDVRSLHEWIGYVGRDHLHHRLMRLGLSPFRTVLAIVALSLITGLAALALVEARHMALWLLLGQGVVIYMLLSFFMVLAARRVKQNE